MLDHLGQGFFGNALRCQADLLWRALDPFTLDDFLGHRGEKFRLGTRGSECYFARVDRRPLHPLALTSVTPDARYAFDRPGGVADREVRDCVYEFGAVSIAGMLFPGCGLAIFHNQSGSPESLR